MKKIKSKKTRLWKDVAFIYSTGLKHKLYNMIIQGETLVFESGFFCFEFALFYFYLFQYFVSLIVNV